MSISTPERTIQYFRAKARQLDTLADLPVCEHPTLIGGHREEINRIYLSEVLPRRYAVGRGMVYGLVQRSKEADIVIWDAQNYPALPMSDHSFFFAESVHTVLESKSSWSLAAFEDVKQKCGSVRAIVPMKELDLVDEIRAMQQDIYALQTGLPHGGAMLVKPHIGTAAVFFVGGEAFELPKEGDDELSRVDLDWPDALLLLRAGRVILKQNVQDESGFFGRLQMYEVGADALFVFTAALLRLVTQRSNTLEAPFDLTKYVSLGIADYRPVAEVEFPLKRMPPMRMQFWNDDDGVGRTPKKARSPKRKRGHQG